MQAEHDMTSPVTAADYIGTPPVTGIACPDDGEKVLADHIRAPVAALLANDDYLETAVTTGLALKVAKAGDTMTGDLSLSPGVDVAFTGARTYTRGVTGLLWLDATKWQPPGAAGHAFPYTAVQSVAITPLNLDDQVVYAIAPPDGAEIASVNFRAKGSSLLAGLPADLPVITLWKLDLTTGAETSVGTATDATTTLADYKLIHDVTITGLSETVDASNSAYIVRIQGDTGSGGTYGLTIVAPTYDFTRGKLGEE
jgi:hypothetical protein